MKEGTVSMFIICTFPVMVVFSDMVSQANFTCQLNNFPPKILIQFSQNPAQTSLIPESTAFDVEDVL